MKRRLRIAVLAVLALMLLAAAPASQAEARKSHRSAQSRRVEREKRERRRKREKQQREHKKKKAEQEASRAQRKLEREEQKRVKEEGSLESPIEEIERPLEEEGKGKGTGGLVVGVDTGGWAGGLISELASSGIDEFRVSSSVATAVNAEAPGDVASIIFGEGGTIGSINPTAYAAEVAAVSAAADPQSVEVLNEPGGSWFWSDPTDYSAYTKLAKAVHEALQALPAAARPQEICSWDGGEAGSDRFGQGIKAAGALPYCDGVTVHPYGGASGGDGGAKGNRPNVERAHSESGLPVYVTEIGWPTDTGGPATGDSQQWTEAQQAENMKSFATWAQSTGYVKMVLFFNAVDYGTNTLYGIEKANRQHKQSYNTLAALSG